MRPRSRAPLTSRLPRIAATCARGRARERLSRRGRCSGLRGYEFFERARRLFGADVVALGHTRDDQAETFLLRLIRGAGPRGLAAMSASRERWCVRSSTAGGTSCATISARAARRYVDDESNRDTRIPRNRVRAELLPLLEQAFNPAIVDDTGARSRAAR